MRKLEPIIVAVISLLISGCSDEPAENTSLDSDLEQEQDVTGSDVSELGDSSGVDAVDTVDDRLELGDGALEIEVDEDLGERPLPPPRGPAETHLSTGRAKP